MCNALNFYSEKIRLNLGWELNHSWWQIDVWRKVESGRGNGDQGASVFDLSSPSKIDSKANRMLKNDPSLISIQGMSCESNSFFDGYKNGSIMMSLFQAPKAAKILPINCPLRTINNVLLMPLLPRMCAIFPSSYLQCRQRVLVSAGPEGGRERARSGRRWRRCWGGPTRTSGSPGGWPASWSCRGRGSPGGLPSRSMMMTSSEHSSLSPLSNHDSWTRED